MTKRNPAKMKAYRVEEFTRTRSPAMHLRIGLYTMMLMAALLEIFVG